VSSRPDVDTARTSTKDSLLVFSVCTRSRYGAAAIGEPDGDSAGPVEEGVGDDDGVLDGDADGDAPVDIVAEADEVPLGEAGPADGDATAVGTHSEAPSLPQYVCIKML